MCKLWENRKFYVFTGYKLKKKKGKVMEQLFREYFFITDTNYKL